MFHVIYVLVLACHRLFVVDKHSNIGIEFNTVETLKFLVRQLMGFNNTAFLRHLTCRPRYTTGSRQRTQYRTPELDRRIYSGRGALWKCESSVCLFPSIVPDLHCLSVCILNPLSFKSLLGYFTAMYHLFRLRSGD